MRLAAPLALTAALGVGCVSSDNSVYIETAVSINGSNNCLPDKNNGQPLPAGTLDILDAIAGRPGRGYQAALQVVTNLPATFTNQDLGQGQTQAPNYQDYGPTDNNVMVFQSGQVSFSFISEPGVNTADWTCAGDECTKDGQNQRVTGTVFNQNNALSTKGVVFLEMISAREAADLAKAFKDILAPGGQASPTARKRIIAEVSLTAHTTGSAELRPVTTFPFPFAIDLCAGCLVPDEATCGRFGAGAARGERVEAADAANVCFAGQDLASFECDCGGTSCF